MVQWVMSHLQIILPLVVAILDFVIALIPGIAANGIFHAVYLWIKSLIVKAPSA